jgi:hypothetical protein
MSANNYRINLLIAHYNISDKINLVVHEFFKESRLTMKNA